MLFQMKWKLLRTRKNCWDLTLYSVQQLERCSQEGKIFVWGGQNFWVGLLFSEISVDLQQKKKSSRQIGLVFSKISIDLDYKKPPSWYCSMGKESLGGHAGQFGGAEFLFRGSRALPP